MSIDGDMHQRHGRVLAELAEAGMAMVRRLSQAMEGVEDVSTQVQIGLAFHRVSRAVRQTMALEFRLAQEARREDRGGTPGRSPGPPAPPLVTCESAAPRPAPERVGWSEHERDDSDEALDALDALLEAEDFDVETVHEAVEASMASIRRDIAADPLLMKAGVLRRDNAALSRPGGLAPPPPPSSSRRSALMGAAAFARPALAAPPRAGSGPGKPVWRSSG